MGLVQDSSNVPEEQWDLPIGFKDDGTPMSLREFKNIERDHMHLAAITFDDLQNLVTMRIKAQDKYPSIMMLGKGKVDKERALQEIRENSDVGEYIVELERRVIEMMKEEAQKNMPPDLPALEIME